MSKSSFLVYLLGLFFLYDANAVGATESGCKIETKYINFQVIKAKLQQQRIPFRDVKDPLMAEAPEMKTYLMPGDLVTTDSIETITKYGKSPKPHFICAEYRSTTGRKSKGWIPSDNLLQVLNTNNPDELGPYNQYPEELKLLLKSIPPSIGLASGGLWRNGSHSSGDNPFSIRLNISNASKVSNVSSDKNPISFKFGDLPATNFQDRFGSTFLDPSAPVNKCGLSAILFNNALLIRSEASGICWGNHGDSNPDGAYYSK